MRELELDWMLERDFGADSSQIPVCRGQIDRGPASAASFCGLLATPTVAKDKDDGTLLVLVPAAGLEAPARETPTLLELVGATFTLAAEVEAGLGGILDDAEGTGGLEFELEHGACASTMLRNARPRNNTVVGASTSAGAGAYGKVLGGFGPAEAAVDTGLEATAIVMAADDDAEGVTEGDGLGAVDIDVETVGREVETAEVEGAVPVEEGTRGPGRVEVEEGFATNGVHLDVDVDVDIDRRSAVVSLQAEVVLADVDVEANAEGTIFQVEGSAALVQKLDACTVADVDPAAVETPAGVLPPPAPPATPFGPGPGFGSGVPATLGGLSSPSGVVLGPTADLYNLRLFRCRLTNTPMLLHFLSFSRETRRPALVVGLISGLELGLVFGPRRRGR
ncbi:hypothetical protein GALMADRAFT_214591 [Galerina marginata CBS 339.88]|uniref:Uncharacterized protein n=1 Tax=Galerina marginata (strain CBS 339.88) TaxID=685588 RepID=A0A067STP3_GALM3|nr:hypothetical protein GALMADRAFT_214591 [Galerina marginata CBS 339.88]